MDEHNFEDRQKYGPSKEEQAAFWDDVRPHAAPSEQELEHMFTYFKGEECLNTTSIDFIRTISITPTYLSDKGSRWKKQKRIATTQKRVLGRAQKKSPVSTQSYTENGSMAMQR